MKRVWKVLPHVYRLGYQDAKKGKELEEEVGSIDHPRNKEIRELLNQAKEDAL